MDLKTIFNNIQKCDYKTTNEYLAKCMPKIGPTGDFADIIHTLLMCNRNSLAPRIMSFLNKIFAALKSSNPDNLRAIFDYIIIFTLSKSTRARKHALQLVLAILSLEKYDLKPATLQEIIERLFDKDVSVRKEAIKIGLMYQDVHLNAHLTVLGTIKDVLRYDPVASIRKAALLGISIDTSTVNCTIERCMDKCMGVRQAFWLQCYKNMGMGLITPAQKIFLMKTAFTEREFDARSIFIDSVRKYGVELFADECYVDDVVYRKLIRACISKSSDRYVLRDYSLGNLTVYYEYCKMVEETEGRDQLALIPLGEYMEKLCTEIWRIDELHRENKAGDCDSAAVNELFKILEYYDVFGSEVCKRLLKIIFHLLTKCKMAQVVERAVVLSTRICYDDIGVFLGSIIKHTKGTPLCILLSEFIMKHVPFSEMHEAIMQEIVLLNLNESLGVVYWYLVKHNSTKYLDLYISFLPNVQVIKGAVDLVLMGALGSQVVIDVITPLLSSHIECAVIPASKIMLFEPGFREEPNWAKNLLIIYYTTKTADIQQYLSIFFYEYFSLCPASLIAIFPEVLEIIVANQKIFIDQSLFWLGNSQEKDAKERMFLEVLIYIYSNYSTLQNRKYHFKALEMIAVAPNWNRILIKKCLYVLALIIKKRPRENTHLLVSRLMENDDGIPITEEGLQQVMLLLKNRD